MNGLDLFDQITDLLIIIAVLAAAFTTRKAYKRSKNITLKYFYFLMFGTTLALIVEIFIETISGIELDEFNVSKYILLIFLLFTAYLFSPIFSRRVSQKPPERMPKAG